MMADKPSTSPKSDGDMVSHPPHYTFGNTEVLDVIEDWQLNFHRGQVVKYVARAGRKHKTLAGTILDLEKARFYLTREIALLYKHQLPIFDDSNHQRPTGKEQQP